MSSYPWLGRVLFKGDYYPANSLPKTYLPTLLTIQFTEPTIVLFVLGFILATFHLIQNKQSGLFFFIIMAWFFFPITILILTERPLYDNFRQLLFLVPPIFLISGFALDWILHLVKQRIYALG